MNIKKQVFDEIGNFILREYGRIQSEIQSNKWKFKKLEYEQTLLKRKRAELQELVNYCNKRKELENVCK